MNGEALERAVYNRLDWFTDLTSLVTGIYTRVPQPDDAGDDALFPYVLFNVPSSTPFDTKTSNGTRDVVQFHVYSRSGSNRERLAIEQAIYDALHKYDLVISGANTVTVNFTSRTDFMDPDGVTTHGVLNFVVLQDDT